MIYLIILLLLLLAYTFGISLWFEKAGEAAWKAYVPYFRIKTWVKLTNGPKWFVWGSFIPVVNLFIYTNLIGETSDTYRRYSFWEHTIAILGGWFWLPYLGKNKDEIYHGAGGLNGNYLPPQKSKTREWADAIIFAIFAAYIIRTFVFEIYAIPTSSMEGTLRVGDVLVVSKFHYGSRVPMTPLAFPLVHHSFPKFLGGGKAYLEWIKLPYKRLPALETIDRNDMVVFNFPANDTTTWELDSEKPYYDLVRDEEKKGNKNAIETVKNEYTILVRPVDKRENYIKRCVGLPGDTLKIVSGDLFVNGELAYQAQNIQYRYSVYAKSYLSPEFFLDLDITEAYLVDPNTYSYIIFTSPTKATQLEAFDQIAKVNRDLFNSEENFADYEYSFYPYHKDFKWNVDNFGPIVIPHKGMTVTLNKANYLLYQRCITVYENNTLEIIDNKPYVNGIQTNTYTFKMDYYWMMGDNRNQSQDSRYWGFVPEDHIVGKAWFLVISYSKENKFLRLNRTFKGIHSNWAPKDVKYTR